MCGSDLLSGQSSWQQIQRFRPDLYISWKKSQLIFSESVNNNTHVILPPHSVLVRTIFAAEAASVLVPSSHDPKCAIYRVFHDFRA
jgi:hypothetical protein